MQMENEEIKMYYITDPLTGFCVGSIMYFKGELHHIYLNKKIEYFNEKLKIN